MSNTTQTLPSELPAPGSPGDGDNVPDTTMLRLAMGKIHFEVILERRWVSIETPEVVRRALLGAFACVVGANAGDKDVEWGLAFLRALAAEHLALPESAVEDVEMLAKGAWPEGEAPTHCFEDGRAGEWAEQWKARATPHKKKPTGEMDREEEGARPERSTASDVDATTAAKFSDEDLGFDAEDATSYRYSTAWERCLVEILTRLVTSREYSAPARAALRRVAAAAGVSWRLLIVVEDELATVLKAARAAEEGGGSAAAEARQADRANSGEDDKGGVVSSRGGGLGPLALPVCCGEDGGARSTLGKWFQVGGIATLGGVALVLTGGLAAPAMLGTITALGATGGIIGVAAGGVAATVAAIGGTIGITIIFGASGAGLAGWKMARRTAGLTDFAFKPVRGEDTGLPVIIYVPGFHVLGHQLMNREFLLASISGVGVPNVFGCWGGDTGMFKALFVEEDVKIGWTLRDIEDSYGVNHAVVVQVEQDSPADAAGVNVGAVVYELLTPEGMDWQVECTEDFAVMSHKRPLMVFLRRCMPIPKYDFASILKPEQEGAMAVNAGTGFEHVIHAPKHQELGYWRSGGDPSFLDDDRLPQGVISRSDGLSSSLRTGVDKRGGCGKYSEQGRGNGFVPDMFGIRDDPSSANDCGFVSSEDEGMEMSTMQPMTPSKIPFEILAERKAHNGRGALPMERPRELSSPSTANHSEPSPFWRGAGSPVSEGKEMKMMDPMPEEDRPKLSLLRPIPSWQSKFVLPCPIRCVPRSVSPLSAFNSPMNHAKTSLRVIKVDARLNPTVFNGGRASDDISYSGAGIGGPGFNIEGNDDSLSAGQREPSLSEDDRLAAINATFAAGAAIAQPCAETSSSTTVYSASTASTVTCQESEDETEVDDDPVEVDWPITNGEQYVLQWETDTLANLGADMMSFSAGNHIGSAAVSTAMSAVLATAMLPVTVLESVSSLDNPWSITSERVEVSYVPHPQL